MVFMSLLKWLLKYWNYYNVIVSNYNELLTIDVISQIFLGHIKKFNKQHMAPKLQLGQTCSNWFSSNLVLHFWATFFIFHHINDETSET